MPDLSDAEDFGLEHRRVTDRVLPDKKTPRPNIIEEEQQGLEIAYTDDEMTLEDLEDKTHRVRKRCIEPMLWHANTEKIRKVISSESSEMQEKIEVLKEELKKVKDDHGLIKSAEIMLDDVDRLQWQLVRLQKLHEEADGRRNNTTTKTTGGFCHALNTKQFALLRSLHSGKTTIRLEKPTTVYWCKQEKCSISAQYNGAKTCILHDLGDSYGVTIRTNDEITKLMDFMGGCHPFSDPEHSLITADILGNGISKKNFSKIANGIPNINTVVAFNVTLTELGLRSMQACTTITHK